MEIYFYFYLAWFLLLGLCKGSELKQCAICTVTDICDLCQNVKPYCTFLCKNGKWEMGNVNKQVI